MKKKVLVWIFLFVSFCALLNLPPAYAKSIDDSDVFLTQNTNYTCTLSSAAMMLRRRAILDNENWQGITENSLRATAWIEGVGLRRSFSFNGISVGRGYFSNVVQELIAMLNEHPEGIVVYNTSQLHAILVTDYDNTTGNFFCADPMLPSGRIPVASSTLSGGDLQSKLAGVSA